jgi:hypothetical protein
MFTSRMLDHTAESISAANTGQYSPFCCEQIDGGLKQEYITNER